MPQLVCGQEVLEFDHVPVSVSTMAQLGTKLNADYLYLPLDTLRSIMAISPGFPNGTTGHLS